MYTKIIKFAKYFQKFFKRNKTKNMTYSNYQQYLDHQKEKTLDPVRQKKWLGEEWKNKMDEFEISFNRHKNIISEAKKALCIGARTGQEVQVLKDWGIDAVGVDLVPFPPLVLEGDFHNLPFKKNTFDFVFSNTYDHSLYPEKFIHEIERVLAPGGHVLLHFQLNTPIRSDGYDVTYVASSKEVLQYFGPHNIVVNQSMPNCLSMNWELLLKK